jgi:hypothetical protein
LSFGFSSSVRVSGRRVSQFVTSRTVGGAGGSGCRRATRGCKILAHGDQAGTKQNRVQAADLFSSEASLIFHCDWIETGPGEGPGTWASVAETGVVAAYTTICRSPPWR